MSTLYPTLDLHGMTAEEAVATARAWLQARRLDSDLTVRIITGRGLHSIGPAVLPGEIEDLLRSLRGPMVSGFEREPGGGVYRVRLVAERSRRGVEPRRRAHDPALVRQAEEALADLGIHATPVLVEEEIRRILKERAESAE